MTPTHDALPRRRLVAVALATMLALAGIGATTTPAEAAEDYEVLVVGKTLGFRHSSIDDATRAIIDLGADNGFTVDVWDPPNDSGGWWGPGSPGQPELTLDSTPFTSAEDLSAYSTIVFVSPVDNTNSLDPDLPRLLDDDELAAFQGYIRDGGGFTGLHAATDTMHTVPWYSELTGGGARFAGHPAQQTATMVVEDQTHPSTQMLPEEWTRFDEWYYFTTNPREDVRVLISMDESTYDPGRAMGDHPIAWCHNFEGGRSWYEGAGHTDASYTEPLFLEHLLGGIEWSAGVVDGGGDCVTFAEVDELLDGIDVDSRRAEVLTAKVSERLDAAEAAADAGDHRMAVRELRKAAGMAHGLQHDQLPGKITDLVTWQQDLADA